MSYLTSDDIASFDKLNDMLERTLDNAESNMEEEDGQVR